MRSRLDILEEAVMQIRKEMKWIKGIAYYLAGVMTINLGVSF